MRIYNAVVGVFLYGVDFASEQGKNNLKSAVDTQSMSIFKLFLTPL